jgi:hypothetical protein
MGSLRKKMFSCWLTWAASAASLAGACSRQSTVAPTASSGTPKESSSMSGSSRPAFSSCARNRGRLLRRNVGKYTLAVEPAVSRADSVMRCAWMWSGWP